MKAIKDKNEREDNIIDKIKERMKWRSISKATIGVKWVWQIRIEISVILEWRRK